MSSQTVLASGFSVPHPLAQLVYEVLAHNRGLVDLGIAFSQTILDLWAQDTKRAGNLLCFPAQLERAYDEAKQAEAHGPKLAPEQPPDFSSIRKHFPDIRIAPQTLPRFPFCRVWNLDHAGVSAAPVFVLVSPNSGNTAEKALGAAETFLSMGHVRLVEYLDPRRVPAEQAIDLDSSAQAVAEIARINPGCYLAGPSHGGLVATLATGLAPDLVTGLIVIGSPINPHAANGIANQAADIQKLFPERYVTVGENREGRGRKILPPGVMQLVYRDIIGEACENNDPQALPAELVSGPRGMLKWYLEAPLAKTGIGAFRGHVIMIVGNDDRIVPKNQTLFLKKATPKAASHTSRALDTGHYGLLKSDLLMPHLTEILEACDPKVRSFRQRHQLPMLAS